MPEIHIVGYRQTAVLWRVVDPPDEAGRNRVTNPVEVKCRWETTSREGVDSKGANVTLEALVEMDEDVLPGAVMWRGYLADFDPNKTDTMLLEVRTKDRIPSVDNKYTVYEYGLTAYKNDLPEVTT